MLAQAPFNAILQKRLCLSKAFPQCLRAALFHEIRRIKVVRKRNRAQIDARAPRLGRNGAVNELQRAIGGALTRFVAIEKIDDPVFRMTR